MESRVGLGKLIPKWNYNWASSRNLPGNCGPLDTSNCSSWICLECFCPAGAPGLFHLSGYTWILCSKAPWPQKKILKINFPFRSDISNQSCSNWILPAGKWTKNSVELSSHRKVYYKELFGIHLELGLGFVWFLFGLIILHFCSLGQPG